MVTYLCVSSFWGHANKCMAFMRKRRYKSDYELVAGVHGVTPAAVKKAVDRQNSYPNNRLVKTFNKLQKAKSNALKNVA